MNDSDRTGIAADEAAREDQYSGALATSARVTAARIRAQVPNTMTDNTKINFPRSGELYGRVALRAPSELLDGARDYYIGTSHYDGEDFAVFSWAAEIACSFYRRSTAHHQLCDDVVGVRVLAHEGGRIVDFEDEATANDAPAELFPRRQLRVPKAPLGAPLPPPAAPAAPASTAPASTTPPPGADASTPTAAQLGGAPGAASIPLRTPDLLRRQLAAPKKATMSAVLSTLQPDQYEAITRPAADSQILQGHPGTGKTIIAAHRAAYLVSPESVRGVSSDGAVLILGPTTEYVAHVREVLQTLIDDPTRYEVRAISSLLEELAGLPRSDTPTDTFLWEDVSPDLARLVDLAYARTRQQLDNQGEKPTASDVYAELLWLLEDPPADGLEPEWVLYLRQLPKTYELMKQRIISSYRGLMAYIGVRTTRMPNPVHVIVDEAQDIHPIEWEVLGRLGNRGGWTILGDLNQRRTDHTFNSWDDVAQLLAIEDEAGRAPLQVLERGYRSTAPIIRFANQLLPARERRLFSIQDEGEHPHVARVTSARELADTAFRAAEQLMDQVGSGTVAIITMNSTMVRTTLTKRGWQAGFGDPFTWRSGERVLKLLPPERARGLEFDGVVVVEPAEFPENVGRQGVLYTALTRANRLLTVVYNRPLPRGMKARL